jgi:hypothetical protein
LTGNQEFVGKNSRGSRKEKFFSWEEIEKFLGRKFGLFGL